MDYSKIGINKCYQINDFKIKTTIIKSLFTIDIKNLKEYDMDQTILKNKIKYKVAYLEEGNNYILFLKKLNNIYYTLLIKKNFDYDYNKINFNNLEIYFLDITYSELYYNGTIIEGRLDNKLEFNIYNILKLKGIDINNLTNTENHIKNEIKELSNKYFTLKLINYINLENIKYNDCIGLLFINIDTKVKYINLFKKNNNITKKYAILYMSKLNTDVFNLKCLKNNKKFIIGIAHIPNSKTSHYFNKYDKEIIVKCWYNNFFNKWVPYEISTDKISTHQHILDSTIKI
jgi:hypothetical protein